MRKLAVLILVLGGWAGSVAQAEEADIETPAESKMRCMQNFDRKIKSLENYTITFSDDKEPAKKIEPVNLNDDVDINIVANK